MSNDKFILRELAHSYAEIANSHKNLSNTLIHKNVNDLKTKKPIVLIGEVPWHEMNINDELTLHCTNPKFREAENELRRTLFQWRHFPADMIVAPYWGVSKLVNTTGCGIQRQLNDKDSSHVQSHLYANQIATIEDIDKLHKEVITYDKETTMQNYEMFSNIFGDILPVKVVGQSSGYGMACKIWDDISLYKSLDALLFDLIDEPQMMHHLAEKLTDILIDVYNQYDTLGLWEANSYENHSTTALSNDLKPDYAHTTRGGVWGRGIAQIFASVSPEMHDEFDIAYQMRALKDFGLVYYGCCEPLHKKIHIIEKISNLRKISITPWADVDISSEIIGSKYVMSSKPNPSFLAADNINEDYTKAELTRIVNAAKRNDCSCDIVLKDITTVNGNPQNLFRWEKIAMDIVNNC